MFTKRFLAILFSSILGLTAACSGGTGSPAQDPTAVIETRVAELVAATAAAQQAVGTNVAATLTAMSLTSPAQTPPAAPSSEPAATITPFPPMVSVAVQTNCRSGPGTSYEVLGMLNVGESAQVVGRSLNNDNWIIKLPSNPGVTCWLWGQYAALRGDAAGLPVIAPPPTPTPGTGFKFLYQTYWDCLGTSLVVFSIQNTGSISWESNQVTTTDLSDSLTQVAARDDFPSTFNCSSVSNADHSLAAGQMGSVISASIAGLPSGHEFYAVIRLCTGDGLSGFCLDQPISFTFTPSP
jgi:hypothetical protein